MTGWIADVPQERFRSSLPTVCWRSWCPEEILAVFCPFAQPGYGGPFPLLLAPLRAWLL